MPSTYTIAAGDRFTVDVNATDADAGDTLTYSLTQRPTGATINSYTGLVSWQTSTATTTGNHTFGVSVSDGTLTDTASFTVTVKAPANTQPQIVGLSSTYTVTAGDRFTVDVNATDADAGDTLTYSLIYRPYGATINSQTGLVSWQTSTYPAGSYRFDVTVSDGTLTDTASFTVTVKAPANSPPQIDSMYSTYTITAGDRFTVDVNATDADAGDTLTYSLTQRPTGATINSYTGLVSWQTSTATTTGNHAFSVSVSDGKTADTASFTVMVNAAPPPPPPPTTTPPAPSSTAFTEDFESGFGKWTVSGNWQAETLDDTNAAPIPGHTKSNIVAEGDGCNTACTMTLTTPLDLSSYANATLEFDRFEDGALASTDYLKVEVGKNGVYTEVLHYPDSTVNDVWTPETYDMSSYLTSGITIRFTAETTSTRNAEVAVDNISIIGSTVSTPPPSTPNNPPQIGSIPSTLSVTAGDRFTVDIDATDADAGDTLTYSLTQRPTGATINSQTGLVSWQTSTTTATGSHTFSVSVSDGTDTDTASFTVTVNSSSTNSPPQINTISSTLYVTAGYEFVVKIDATDADAGDTLTYSLSSSPSGATINPLTGFINWHTTSWSIGNHTFGVSVSDGTDTASKSFTVTVTSSSPPSNNPPQIGSIPSLSVTAGNTFVVKINATDADADDTLTYRMSGSPTNAYINSQTGFVIWQTSTSTRIGYHVFDVSVSDNKATDTASFTVKVDAPPPPPPPPPPPQTTNSIAFTENFESGFGNWTVSGDWFRKTLSDKVAIPGYTTSNIVAEGDGCDTACVLTLTTPLDLSSYTDATLKFDRFEDNYLAPDDYLKVEIGKNGVYTQVLYYPDSNKVLDTWTHETYDMSNYLTSGVTIRFTAETAGNAREVAVDNINITGSTVSPPNNPPQIGTISSTLSVTAGDRFTVDIGDYS